MRIAVVGGGPAGLFFARLMKRRRPSDEVRIFEQNPANATYGFGVTLAGAARSRLRQADAEVHDCLASEMIFNDRQNIVLNTDVVALQYAAAGGAIARLTLLRILEELCESAGLKVEHNIRIEDISREGKFDLIVGADGANSVVRAAHRQHFSPRTHALKNRFVWYGVNKALKPNALVFREHQGGYYVAHYYSYPGNMSTFVAECDGKTWERCGLAQMTDAERKVFVEQLFASELEGEKLVENKSIWRSFNAITSDNWTHGNTVLIGDALRVAHFSIGSGTRLAMDDALALADAFSECGDDVSAALRRFVEIRKPTRDLFTDATVRSYEWYENIRGAMQASSGVAFTKDFLTRTGRVDEGRLKDYVPGFYRDHLAPAPGRSNAS